MHYTQCAIAKKDNGDYSVFYDDEYIGKIKKKGATWFEVNGVRFDRLFMAVKHIFNMWIEQNKISIEKGIIK